MKKHFILILLSVLLVGVSCQKDDELTNGELIAKELQQVIKENNINRVMNFKLDQNWNQTWIIGDYGKNYKFQGQFIFIEGETYNLNNLIRYQIAQKTDGTQEIKFLLLSFY